MGQETITGPFNTTDRSPGSSRGVREVREDQKAPSEENKEEKQKQSFASGAGLLGRQRGLLLAKKSRREAWAPRWGVLGRCQLGVQRGRCLQPVRTARSRCTCSSGT